MTSNEIESVINNSDMWIFGIRSLHSDETVTVGQEMPESYVWDDGNRTEEGIGGTCCFAVIERSRGWDVEGAIKRAEQYMLSGRYALLGGRYTGNNDLIEEPHTVAIREAIVLATWSR